MALAFKLKSSQYTIQRINEDGSTALVDHSLRGHVVYVVDYYDTAQPNNILHTERFVVPASETVPQLTERFNAFGRMVRDARTRASEMNAYVNQQVLITDPPTS